MIKRGITNIEYQQYKQKPSSAEHGQSTVKKMLIILNSVWLTSVVCDGYSLITVCTVYYIAIVIMIVKACTLQMVHGFVKSL